MKSTGKRYIAAALVLTVLTVTLYALPIFAEPNEVQTQERGEDCPQTCEPCEGCDCNECDCDQNQHRYHNKDYDICGDCICDGTQKRIRTGQDA